MPIQIPALILPVNPPLPTSVELINDLLEHTSQEVSADTLQDKVAFIFAQEVVLAPGVPGNLLIWIEESPYPSTLTAAYWGSPGGGGGAFPPVVLDTIVGTGVNGAIHAFPIHWGGHTPYCRIVVQTPVAAALPVAFWAVQVLFAGKGA